MPNLIGGIVLGYIWNILINCFLSLIGKRGHLCVALALDVLVPDCRPDLLGALFLAQPGKHAFVGRDGRALLHLLFHACSCSCLNLYI